MRQLMTLVDKVLEAVKFTKTRNHFSDLNQVCQQEGFISAVSYDVVVTFFEVSGSSLEYNNVLENYREEYVQEQNSQTFPPQGVH